MDRGLGSVSRRARRRSANVLGLALTALAVAACTVAASPKPAPAQTAAASPAQTAAASPAPMSPTPSDTPLATVPTDSPQPDVTGSPTPPLPKGALPSLGPATTASWTGIDWIAVPGGHAPAVAAVTDDNGIVVNLFGWSDGFIEFGWSPRYRTVVPWTSADGLNWVARPKLDTGAWTADLRDYDKHYAQPGDVCTLIVDAFEQGPDGLLAKAHVRCPLPCGGNWVTSDAMWTSPDGVAWTPVNMSAAFGKESLSEISGGSSGYIALGSQLHLWTSMDGRAWEPGAVPAAALKGDAIVHAPVSFAGGFVLASQMPLPGGCALMERPLTTTSLWWSPDGRNWTQETLPGAFRGEYPDLEIDKISDHALLARESTLYGKVANVAWVSTDGRTWNVVKGGSVLGGLWGGMYIATNDSRCLAYGNGIRTFDDAFNLVILKQTGSKPSISQWTAALGPTGLLVTEDGVRFWMGVPTAG